MPNLTVEQAIEQFNTSAVQAAAGCGQPTAYKITESNSRILLTHPDGCRLDVPFEVIHAMSPDQYQSVFGGLSRTDDVIMELLSELRGEATPDLDPETPLPEVSIDRTLYTAATGSARFAAVRAMTRTSGLGFPNLSAKNLNKKVTKKARGKVFIAAMKAMGVNLPVELALPVGDVLHAMYSSIEAGIDNNQTKVLRIEQAHEDFVSRTRREVQAANDATAVLEADVTRTLALREAAIAWRTSTGSPEEKFAAFNKLMDSIDRVSGQVPPVPVQPVLDGEFPPAALVAELAAADASLSTPQTADNETPR